MDWDYKGPTRTLSLCHTTCPEKKPYQCGSASADIGHQQQMSSQKQTQGFFLFFYPRPKCGKGYNEKKEYETHMNKMHPVEKKHHCTECEKSFSVAFQLLLHQRINTGEKPCGLWKVIFVKKVPWRSSESSYWREAIPLHRVWEELRRTCTFTYILERSRIVAKCVERLMLRLEVFKYM